MCTKILPKFINRIVVTIEKLILVLGVVLLAIILISNVIARAVGKSMYFADEIAMVLMIWIVVAGLSYGVRRGRHISMSAIYDLSSVKTKKIMVFLSSSIGSLTMFFLSYVSTNYLFQVYRFQRLSQTIGLPLWIYYSILPIGFFLAGLNYLLTIIKNIKIKGKEEVWISVEQKTQYEE
jgi:C4-dicarboxylate transporter, DctQ subunit